jgi:hypothetical protein
MSQMLGRTGSRDQLSGALMAENEQCTALADAVLTYDEAIQRHAQSEQWVSSEELDKLYAAMLLLARAVFESE